MQDLAELLAPPKPAGADSLKIFTCDSIQLKEKIIAANVCLADHHRQIRESALLHNSQE